MCAHCQPYSGCKQAPGFLKLFYKKCVRIICLSFRTHVSKSFTWSMKAACIQTMKAKQLKPILHLLINTGKLCLKGGFLQPTKSTSLRPSTDFRTGFLRQLFRHSTIKKQRTRPHSHPWNARGQQQGKIGYKI